MDKDKSTLVKAITKNKMFRVYAVDALSLVNYTKNLQELYSTSAIILGRSLIASLLLAAAVLKGKDSVTIKLQGTNKDLEVILDVDSQGHIKGSIANPHVGKDLTKNNKVDSIGDESLGKTGRLEVSKKSINGEEPYTSEVPLVTGKVGDDFTYYLAKSEQIPSALGVSVDIKSSKLITAGGYLIQTLPGASDEEIGKLEEKLKNIPTISTMLTDDPNPVHIVNSIFGKDNVEILETVPVSFQCSCSKARFAKDLSKIDKSVLKDMIEKDHGAEVTCNFCGRKYNFTESDLKDILATKK